jgi:type VI secretion system protein ImpG
MFTSYFKKELENLKGHAKRFADEHPSLAAMLGTPSSDPDVERLLEGVAYLTADIKRKIDDEFPEILQTLAQMVCPQHLRPIPAATILVFEPRENLLEGLRIPSGTYIDSKPVNGHVSRFRTCRDLLVTPLKLVNARQTGNNGAGFDITQPEIKLQFQTNGILLTEWNENHLRIHLGGTYAEAATIYRLFCQHLKEIRLIPGSGSNYLTLSPNSLTPAGFEADDCLLPYPSNVFPSLQILQEYFLFPEKYLFLDLDLSQWKDRGPGDSFEISFIFSVPDFDIPNIDNDNFLLFAVPAVNLFQHNAEPIIQDHSQSEIIIQPVKKNTNEYRIFSVDRVAGTARGESRPRSYTPFTGFRGTGSDSPEYQIFLRPSILEKETDLFLSLAYPHGTPLFDNEVISIEMTCCNGPAADHIAAGDICIPTSNSSELVTFKNIRPSSVGHTPELEGKLLWDLVSHLSTNYQTINDSVSLQSLLKQYVPADERDKRSEIDNLKRISGILSYKLTPGERIVRSSVLRGHSIQINTKSSHFAGPGDMYLFGSVLEYFLGSCASINTYSELVVEDQLTLEKIRWPTRLGIRPLN